MISCNSQEIYMYHSSSISSPNCRRTLTENTGCTIKWRQFIRLLMGLQELILIVWPWRKEDMSYSQRPLNLTRKGNMSCACTSVPLRILSTFVLKKSLSKIIFLKTNFKFIINYLVIFDTLIKYWLIFALFVNLALIFRELWYDEPPPPKCCSFLFKPPSTATQITIQSASDLENPNPILGKCV